MDKPNPRILIVDDDPNQLAILSDILKRKGLEPVTALSGAEALAQAAVRHMDVALIDLRLEDMSGLVVLRGIKESSPETECLLLTGHASQDSAIQAIQLGAYGYFQKPFDIEQVLLSIQRALEKHSVEEALYESEARYRDLVENSQDLICAHDLQGNLLFVNEAGTKILGYSNETLLKMNLRNILAPEVRDRFDAYLAELQAKGQAHGLMRIQTAGGEIRYLEFKNTLQTEALTAPIARGMARDITERKQAEEALRERDALFYATFHSSPIPISITDVSTEKWVEVNEAFLKATGYLRAEVIGRTFQDINLWKRLEERDKMMKMLLEEGHVNNFEVEINKRNGVPGTMLLSVEKVELDGKPYLLIMGNDITERKQAEESLIQAEEKYHDIFENSLDGIFQSTPTGRFIAINPALASMWGYASPEDLIASITDIMHQIYVDPERRTEFMRLMQEEGKVSAFEFQVFRKNGSVIWVSESAHAVQDKQGALLYYEGNIKDITERKQAEGLLRKSEKRYHDLFEDSPISLREEDFSAVKQRLDTLRQEGVTDFHTYLAVHPEVVVECAEMVRIKDVNKAALKMFRTDSKNNMPNNLTEILGGEALEHFKDQLGNIADGQIEFSWEGIDHTIDGRQIDVEVNWSVAAGYEKDLSKVIVSLQDITERKRAEDALRTSEERFRSLYENSTVGIYRTTPGGRIILANPVLVKMLGFATFDDLADRELEQEGYEPSYPRIQFTDLINRDGEVRGLESAWRRKDGSTIFVRESARIISDPQGNKLYYDGVVEDITERKQAEQSLAASEAELRALFASMKDVVLVIDREGVYRKIAPTNPGLLVRPPQELLGKNLRDVFPAEQAQNFIDSIRQVLETGQTDHIEYALPIGERIIWFSTSISPMTEESTLWVARDVTERRQAEEEIHQRVAELELLYQSGLALGQLLNPHEIAQKIIELLEQKMDWHHTAIRLYHLQDDTLELLAFKQPGLESEAEKSAVEERFKTLISKSGEGLSGWAVQNSQTVRSGDVSNDSRYVDTYPGLHSGLYVPMKLGQRMIGVISIESELPNAFNDTDERLVSTLATQAASAFENAELFDAIRQRVTELEVLNRVSVVLRTITKQDQMLAIVLDETLKALKAENGAIELWDRTANSLEKAMARGWPTEVTEPPYNTSEGIAGRVFTSGENYFSREFASDPVTRAASRSQIPAGWGGICVPIRSAEHVLGTLLIAIPSVRELNKDEIRLLNTLAEMTGASLHRMRLYDETIHHMNNLEALRDVDQAIASNFDLYPTLNTVITHTISQLSVDAADILLLRPHLQVLEYAAGQGFRTHINRGTSVRIGESFAGRAALERHTIHISGLENVQANADFAAYWKSEGFASFYCVPLLAKGEVKGVLEVYQRNQLPRDPEWLNYLETLAGQAAIAIDSTQLFDRLQHANLELGVAYEATIEGWSRALDLRDEETEGHTLRVTEMATLLAQSFNFSDEELQHIRRGVILHDIGKMGVPDHILLKPGPLTDEEWVKMRRHPQLAYDMIKPIQYLHDSLDIPYCHHEKWDGSGYPRGLAGDNIPLKARLFAVVDVYDALTSDRPYRQAWSKEKAIEYIREQSGKHFDPQVVEVFLHEFGK